MLSINEKQEIIAYAKQQFLEEYRELKRLGFINKKGEFFPSVHYPPITMYKPILQEEMFAGYTLPDDKLLDVYAHIPFCKQRCVYCHYPVKFGDQPSEKDKYLDALKREMDIYISVLGIYRIHARSILVGGGTPTYLTPQQLKYFLDFFTHRLDLSKCTQFNYDVDPNTLLGVDGNERIRIMRDYGVDRLTIGINSLNPTILKHMNRHHTVKEALESIDVARKFGFKLNIEFIFGYPGQTIESWIDEIELAMSLDVDEIQLYRLKVEAYGDYQGPIKTIIQSKPTTTLSDEETLTMKKIAINMLKANNFTENIRRVFGRSKKIYSHYAWNQCCMLFDEVGFGLTAFSSLRDRFVLNTQYFDEYYSAIEGGRLPLNRGLVRNKEEQIRWAIILPIKNSFVNKKIFKERTGEDVENVFKEKMNRLKAYGLIVEDEKKIQTTELGAFLADEVAQQFHSPDYIPFPREQYEEGALNPYLP
ncbi:MAG: radical SAM protein [Candidatus Nitrosotenuis sp.]